MGHYYALIQTADGRPNKVVIPPRTTKEITIDGGIDTPTRPVLLYSTAGLAKRSVFVVNTRPEDGKVLLYNGGMETQWISDGDVVAEA